MGLSFSQQNGWDYWAFYVFFIFCHSSYFTETFEAGEVDGVEEGWSLQKTATSVTTAIQADTAPTSLTIRITILLYRVTEIWEEA